MSLGGPRLRRQGRPSRPRDGAAVHTQWHEWLLERLSQRELDLRLWTMCLALTSGRF
jgi:hypothetical protein